MKRRIVRRVSRFAQDPVQDPFKELDQFIHGVCLSSVMLVVVYRITEFNNILPYCRNMSSILIQ
jgi:hypothetical protein